MQVYYPQDDTLMYFVQWHNSVFMSHFDIKYMERWKGCGNEYQNIKGEEKGSSITEQEEF